MASDLSGLNRRAFLYYSKYKHFDDKYPDANMIIQMQLLGFRIDEIPAVMHARSCGTSMHSGFKPVVPHGLLHHRRGISDQGAWN